MRRNTLGLLVGLTSVLVLAHCTGGQSGHEGGLDGPADGPDAGGPVGGAGGNSGNGGGAPNDGAGAGGHGNAGSGGGGCVPTGAGGHIRAVDGTDHDGGLDPAADAGAGECMPDDVSDDDGGTPRDPTPLDSEHVCEQSAVDA